jgi:hypothetical protein
MRTPSIERLMTLFPKDIDRTRAKIIKALGKMHNENDRAGVAAMIALHCLRTYRQRSSLLNQGRLHSVWLTTIVLEAMDELCGTCGVGTIGVNSVSPYAPPMEFLETGDLYTPTLVYRRESDNLYIASPGDILERFE